MLAEADIARGQSITRKCATCHTFDEGGAAKQGPNLYNVVGADIAAREDFGYSDALAAHEGEWTYANLNAFLFKPKSFVKGTKMTFVGLKKTRDRSDVIAYLRTLSATPQPLPEGDSAEPAQQGGPIRRRPCRQSRSPRRLRRKRRPHWIWFRRLTDGRPGASR